MPGKETTDAMFALRMLMEKYREGQRELHFVFVDNVPLSCARVRAHTRKKYAHSCKISTHKNFEKLLQLRISVCFVVASCISFKSLFYPYYWT